MKLLTGTSNQPLAEAIARRLDTKLIDSVVANFSDGEVRVEIKENVRGEDVFVIQSTSAPADRHLMELLIIIDALSRASASRITAVIPYFGYARQDRKVGPRTPITAKLVANLIATAGADRVLTIDLHAGQVQGFFDIPTDNLYAVKVMEEHIRRAYHGEIDKITVVSPDVGGVVRARTLSSRLDNADLAIVDKRRSAPGQSDVMNIIGNVKGKHCVLFDDIVDSGGTLVNAADALIAQGAQSVSAYVSHAVLSGNAVERIEKSLHLRRLVVTDSIGNEAARPDAKKIETLRVDRLLSEAIRRIANEESVSSLFD